MIWENTKLRAAFFGIVFGAWAASGACAVELTILSGGNLQVILKPAVIAELENATGHKLAVSFAPAAQAQKRAMDGEQSDVVLLIRSALDELAQAGKIEPASRTNFAQTASGVIVKRGAPRPDVSTLVSLKDSLLKARSVAYSDPAAGGGVGVFFDGLLRRMDIQKEISAKARFKRGTETTAGLVATGEAEIGVGQLAELLPVSGVDFLRPIAPELQFNEIVAGAVSSNARNPTAAKDFLTQLTGPAFGERIVQGGMEVRR